MFCSFLNQSFLNFIIYHLSIHFLTIYLMQVNWLYCLDPHLGRFDYSSLPQQASMEILIDGITNREKLCGNKDEPKDIKEWKKVTLNEKGEVTEIKWGFLGLIGVIFLQWLPSTVRVFDLWNNFLTGTIDLCHLPETLNIIDTSFNTFNGTLNLENLPISHKRALLS